MMSITSFSTNIARFLGLPHVASRPQDIDHDKVIKAAYRRYTKLRPSLSETLFDGAFLEDAGRTHVVTYMTGQVDRHAAAIALSQSWMQTLPPMRAAARKRLAADSVLAADSFLMQVDAIRHMGIMAPIIPLPAELALEIDQEGAVATVSVTGVLNARSYQAFLARIEALYAAGSRVLVLDVTKVTDLQLSGIYALHSVAHIFRGVPVAPQKDSPSQLRHMSEANLAVGRSERIVLTCANPALREALIKLEFDQIFTFA